MCIRDRHPPDPVSRLAMLTRFSTPLGRGARRVRFAQRRETLVSRSSGSALRTAVAASLLVGALAVLTACSSPGSTPDETSSNPTTEPTVAEGAPSCGTDPVTLKAYFETGFPMAGELTEEFTKQFPNVTFDTREDQFAVLTQNAPRVLADDPPDLMRLPQMSELATDGLLLNLDSYAEAFGWDQWPASQLEQMRVDDAGRRGDGPLYAMVRNFSMAGVVYNKELAAQIGMTEAPATLAELDGYLQAAKDCLLYTSDAADDLTR